MLELGFFIGKLGRWNVAAIVVGAIEQPSDVSGVIYISFEGEWMTRLAREMKNAKLPVDMNKVL